MAVMGLHCAFESQNPVVRGVIISGVPGSPSLDTTFTHRAIKGENFAHQLQKISQDIRTQVAEGGVTMVVVELRDLPPKGLRPPIADMQRRAMVDGALLAATAKVANTLGLRGVEIGQKYGKSKAQAQDDAVKIIGVPSAFKDAGAAALAALALA